VTELEIISVSDCLRPRNDRIGLFCRENDEHAVIGEQLKEDHLENHDGQWFSWESEAPNHLPKYVECNGLIRYGVNNTLYSVYLHQL
jgi:hypothetical protein